MSRTASRPAALAAKPIAPAADHAALAIPPGYFGPLTLPGTGRIVWWTGRVAIGLRHEARGPSQAVSSSALWVQALLLGTRRRRAAQ